MKKLGQSPNNIRLTCFGAACTLAVLFSTTTSAQVIRSTRLVPSKAIPAQVRAQAEALQAAQLAGQALPITGSTVMLDATSAVTADALAAAWEQQKTARLKKLARLTFNRLPSNILETWYKPADENKNADLPPAPRGSFLNSDVRFKLATDKLEKDFTMGNWDSISEFLKLIPDANAKTVYKQILSAASGANASKLQDAQSSGSRVDPRTLQPQYLSFQDILEIAKIAPVKRENEDDETIEPKGTAITVSGKPLESSDGAATNEPKTEVADKKEPRVAKEYIPLFSAAFRLTISRGSTEDDLILLLKEELKREDPVFTKRQMAKIIFGAGFPIPAGAFLPELELAKKDNDHEALNLLSQHYLSVYAKEKKTEHLEQAWHVTQAILAAQDVELAERTTALARAVKLSTEVSEELGQKWLNDSFIAQPETGMEVLGAIGADTSKSLKNSARSANIRLERLTLQNDAVNALFKVSSDQARDWKRLLELLAMNWLREASISYTDDSATTMRPPMQRDVYGNIFYYNQMNSMSRSRNGLVTAIATVDLLEIKPADDWLALVDPTLRPKFDTVLAQLYLKISEQDLALPYIEKLAATHPKKAEALVDEFLTVWTRNHNPNSDRRRTNSYMFMYGFESRAQSIPLTRSKQDRNLKELSDIVKRLANLVEKDLDEKLLVKAFVTCHSTAEVYELKEIERVFGPVAEMKPETIAELATKMRTNLATMWRDAKLQKDKKTKRKKNEIEQEVIDGYELAQRLVRDALKKNNDEWSLVTTQAELLHDENNYRAGLKNSSEFSPRRKQAMELFRKASELYAAKAKSLEEKDYSTRVFTAWYYASLGACDLALIEDQHRADPKQSEAIRAAIEALPEKVSEWHMARFANLLFNRLSSVKPQLKHKYLDLGFKIVGDHKQAKEAKKVHDYYKDLVNEIRLQTAVDGDTRIGHDKPFGVHVSLLHTKEIERESGGFGRYLQNQNSSTYFTYNYGRPTNDYRDKFEESIRETYSEQFEVLSVTFQKPDVKSIPAREDGWRITPYAYMLLKARGPEVDKIPPAHLDLDFLDTSGYAILPVESAALPVDATSFEPRPFEKLSVTQILDERQAEDGKLVLEIKAKAQGLVPDLDEIVSIAPAEFEVTEIEGDGVSVSQFDPDERLPTINSERTWLVSLEAKPGLSVKPKSFEFPQSELELNEMVFQRYIDADLASVEATVNLEARYGKPNYTLLIWIGIGAVLIGFLFIGFVVWLATRKVKDSSPSNLEFYNNLSPFAAISLLQDIHANNGLSDGKKAELASAIDRLEAHYFGQTDDVSDPDIVSEVKKWTRQTRLVH